MNSDVDNAVQLFEVAIRALTKLQQTEQMAVLCKVFGRDGVKVASIVGEHRLRREGSPPEASC